MIGTRLNIQRFGRADLLGYVDAQYAGANIVVGAAGNVDVDAIVAAAEAAFGDGRAAAPTRSRRPITSAASRRASSRATARPTSSSAIRSPR